MYVLKIFFSLFQNNTTSVLGKFFPEIKNEIKDDGNPGKLTTTSRFYKTHKQTMTDTIFVRMHEFDPSRLVVTEAKVKQIKKGNSTFDFVTSDVFYKDNSGKLCELCFEAHPQSTFGISGVYPMGTEEKDKTSSNIEGYQVSYPMTSLDTVSDPNKHEQYMIDLFNALHQAAVEAGKRECGLSKDKRKIPAPSYNAYLAARDDEDWNQFVKPLYAYANKKDANGNSYEDTTKPQRGYFKLITRGKGNDLRSITPIYGPGDKRVDPSVYMNTLGQIHPVFKVSHVYWGSHGKSPYGGSVKVVLYEANFVPRVSTGHTRRLLRPNTAVEEDDTYEAGGNNGSENEDFDNDSSDPLSVLNGKDVEEEVEEFEELPPTKSTPKKSAGSSALAKKKAAAAARRRKAVE